MYPQRLTVIRRKQSTQKEGRQPFPKQFPYNKNTEWKWDHFQEEGIEMRFEEANFCSARRR